MPRRHLTIARSLSAAGLVAAAAYLIWRAVWSIGHAPLPLALPALALEIAGALGSAALVWALWCGTPPEVTPDRAGSPGAGWHGTVDIVVRVGAQSPADIRATLLAARSVEQSVGVTMVEIGARAEVADLAAELGIAHLVVDDGDRNGLHAAVGASPAAGFLLLEAGDIPTTDAIIRLVGAVTRPSIAVVQGRCEVFGGDATERDADGRHELTFERTSLNPALGARGAALFSDAGALVCRAALASVPVTGAGPIEAQWQLSVELMRNGWEIVAPAQPPVFARQASRDRAAVSADRVERVYASRAIVAGPRGVLRGGGLTTAHRLGVLAWTVRPLSGFRRILTFAMLIGVLLGGREPFVASAWQMGVLWLPSFVLVPLGLRLLSGRALGLGDRTRWSLRYAGVALCSLPGCGGPDRRVVAAGAPQTPWTAHMLPAMVSAISVVVVLRGISEQWTHTLGPLPRESLIAALIAAVWLLLMAMDSLRLLARPVQPRRDLRVGSWQSAALEDDVVFMVDVSASGAGLVSERQLMAGSRTVLETTIPTATGCVSVVLPATVRNIRPDVGGGWHIGVEFLHPTGVAANALVEFCLIEPARRMLGEGGRVAPSDDLVHLPNAVVPRRSALRLAAAFAMLGVIASAVPTAVNAEAPNAAGAVRATVATAPSTPVLGSVTMVVLLLSLTAALATSLALATVHRRPDR